MKRYLVIVLFGFTCHAQNVKVYDYSSSLTCQEINEGITDSELYKTVDGRIIFKEEYDKSKMFKITVNNGKFFYVSKRLKTNIQKVIKKEKCIGVKIEKIPVLKYQQR